MSDATIFGLSFVITVTVFEAYILWRYPDLRRAFIEHWRPSAVAKRIDRWVERQEARR
jgi:hypothetical protein